MLRHNAAKKGLTTNGWGGCMFKDVLTVQGLWSYTEADLRMVVAHSVSRRGPRFELREEGGELWVGATESLERGSSFPQMAPPRPLPMVRHNTTPSVVPAQSHEPGGDSLSSVRIGVHTVQSADAADGDGAPVARSPGPSLGHSPARSSTWRCGPVRGAPRGRGNRGGRRYQPRGFVQGVALGEPENWGVTVKQIWDFWHDIKDDLLSYCADHGLDSMFRHVCRRAVCQYDHCSLPHVPMMALTEEEQDEVEDLKPTMHVVVGRYIKPRTMPHSCSYALMVNKDRGLKADTFISHSWNHPFGDFVSTLLDALDQADSVWVCSFALDQNADITEELGSNVLRSPFATALKAANEVILVFDGAVEPLSRSWCVYELYLATICDKKLDGWTHNWSRHLAGSLADRMRDLDVRRCSATNRDDHNRIMEAIRNKEDDVNNKVRKILRSVVKKVGAMSRDQGSPAGQHEHADDNAGEQGRPRGQSTEDQDEDDEGAGDTSWDQAVPGGCLEGDEAADTSWDQGVPEGLDDGGEADGWE